MLKLPNPLITKPMKKNLVKHSRTPIKEISPSTRRKAAFFFCGFVMWKRSHVRNLFTKFDLIFSKRMRFLLVNSKNSSENAIPFRTKDLAQNKKTSFGRDLLTEKFENQLRYFANQFGIFRFLSTIKRVDSLLHNTLYYVNSQTRQNLNCRDKKTKKPMDWEQFFKLYSNERKQLVSFSKIPVKKSLRQFFLEKVSASVDNASPRVNN